MAGINVCATLGGNLGRPGCDVRMGRIKFLLLTTGKQFTAEQIASSEAFQDALQESMLLENSSSTKVFAFPEMRDVTNNSGDPATGTLADGYEEVLNEALPKYLAKSTPGVCVQQAMASFNGWPGRFYFIDENNIFWFIVTTAGGAKAFTCGYLYTNPPAPKGSGDVQTANTRLTFGSINELKSNVGALKLDFDVSSLVNVQDVELYDAEDENVSGSLNNTFLIGAKTVCEGTDLYTTHSALLTAARWRAYTAAGDAIAITSVTPTGGYWQVVLNSAAYNALAEGTVFYIDLVAPATLAAAGIDGIEAKKLRFVKFEP